MTLNPMDDVVIKIVAVDRDGKKLEIQKLKVIESYTTVKFLRGKVINSAKTPQNWKNVELKWTDKDGDQVRLDRDVNLEIAINEMGATGLTVTATEAD